MRRIGHHMVEARAREPGRRQTVALACAKRELDGKNLALHCYRLGFHHPTRKEWMVFSAAPDWRGRFVEAIQRLVSDGS